MSEGYYRIKLFGQAGAVLYECIVPPHQSFQYVSSYGGLKVYGFEMIWEPVLTPDESPIVGSHTTGRT